MKIISGFEFLNSKHCITGSMLHLFHFHNCPISEEMLLGIGSGIGYMYWHQKGDLPFLGGRANTARGSQNRKCLEIIAAERCGVSAQRFTTSSPAKAEKTLLSHLEKDTPIMLQTDMGLLPYFSFFGQFHFGYHGIVAAGYDPQTNDVTIADRDATPYAVSLEQVSLARNSTFKPFPPKNAWMEYDFSGFHQPEKETLREAILECAQAMLNPPIRNMGVKGILSTKERIRDWPKVLGKDQIELTCKNTALYFRADAGTGGGLFRWMYAIFLQEAADILKNKSLNTAASDFQSAGDSWEQLADVLESITGQQELERQQEQISAILDQIAYQERSGWSTLRDSL
jgi:hypothetical protein